MRLQRLFDMSPAELAFRGRQEVFKVVERLGVPERRKDFACRFDAATVGAPLKALLKRSGAGETPVLTAELQRALQDRMSRRFFAGLRANWSDPALEPRLGNEFGFEAQRLIARADAICRYEFETLGYGALSFGRPINWHLDPVSGRESPVVHWSRLDPLAPEQVGDSKVVWEVNRHQWLLDLGQAYRLTGEEKYADTFVELVTDWMDHNPYGRGINWSSALEAAMRLLSWLWALGLFRGAAALSPQVFQRILRELQRHAGFIERYQSRYFSPNTHLTVEALALYTIGTVLPELQGAGRWRALGRDLLLEQLPLQVPDDGVYFEQSTRYQYYTVEIYLHFAVLAACNDDPLPAIVKERLGAMLAFLLAVRRPDGTVPQIGDTDGGWLCPLVRRSVGDYQGLFSTAALFLEDPQLAWAAVSLTPEAFCLLGEQAGSDWASLTRQAPSPDRISVHGSEGYVVMRSGWERNAHQLIFDTGPLGDPVCAGHAHADLLAVQCSAFGENYLVDPGTGAYTDGSDGRQYFRSTRAHSTVLVDGHDQAAPDGPFAWSEQPAARLLAVEEASRWVFAAAQHEAYARLDDPVTHRRRVWFLDSAAWLIVDDLLGTAEHQVDLRFQFAPLPVDEEADGWIRARGRAGGLLLKTFSTTDLETTVVAGAHEPLRGWYSPNYGQQLPAPALTVRGNSPLPLRFATLIVPGAEPDAPVPNVASRIQDGLLTGLSVSDRAFSMPGFGAVGSVRADDAGVTS